MKIKTKLRLGFGFLFVVVIFFGAISLYYMNKISVSSKVILKDNYESLNFSGEMRKILDESVIPLSQKEAEQFGIHLAKERNNITEKGEHESVLRLAEAYKIIVDPAKNISAKQLALNNARLQLRIIDEVNMNAIVRKNAAAQRGVEKAATYLIFAASMCFLILFSFVVNFPGFVANPLKEFSEAIKEISRKNYKQRLEFNGTDEFSELATEFNAMAAQLNKWENSNLAKLQSEKLRIEAIIEQMQDAIIGLNEKKRSYF
ncbi:HAMP domain-containing protein [Pedobacter panaciterrae]